VTLGELYDAVIVGAGPAGSYAAYRLAKLGHRVIVFEQRASVGDGVCCTGILGAECFERFPVARNAVLREARSAKFLSPSGKALRVHKESVQAYVVDRGKFDEALAARAKEEGAEYLLSARVASVVPGERGVKAEVEYGCGTVEFESRVCVIACGLGGSLTRKLGLGRISDSVFGAQADVAVTGVDEVEVYLGQGIAPGFFAWLVPTAPGKGLAGLLVRSGPRSCLDEFLLRLAADGKIVSTDVECRFGAIPLVPLPRTCVDRVVVVGDAAGQVKPTTGGGIYYGLLCADMAADTVHEAIRAGDLSGRRLSDYEHKWRKRLSGELQTGYFARRLYEKLSDSQIERIFELIRANGIHEKLLEAPGFSFDWHSGSILNALKQRPVRGALWGMARSILPP
jgi:geranylgeranyl reductase family protein